MAQVNVYVPDELKERLDAAELPLSPLARDAWERELRRAEEAEGAGEMRVDAVDQNGDDVELRFTGEDLGGGVYRTDDNRAILVDEDGYSVWAASEIGADEDAFSDAVFETLRSTHGGNPVEEWGDILREFGLKPIVQL